MKTIKLLQSISFLRIMHLLSIFVLLFYSMFVIECIDNNIHINWLQNLAYILSMVFLIFSFIGWNVMCCPDEGKKEREKDTSHYCELHFEMEGNVAVDLLDSLPPVTMRRAKLLLGIIKTGKILTIISNDSSLHNDLSYYFKRKVQSHILLEAAEKDGRYITRILIMDSCQGMSSKKESVIISMQKGLKLQDVDELYKKDKDIVLMAVMKDSEALQYADNKLKKDKEFILRIVKKKPYALKYVDDSLKADKDVVLAAMEKNTSVYKFASESLKKDKDVLSLVLVLELSGYNSPLPERSTVRILRIIEKGMVLKVITTDPGMRTDIPFMVKNRGNILLEKTESENESRCEFLIKKEEDSN